MRRVNGERGAVMIIVAICMVVLVGMAAFVVDVAAMYQERRELQNGADAAALAIADECLALELDGDPSTTCTLGAAAVTADAFARANAGDGAADASVEPDDWDPTSRATVRTSTRRADGTSAISFVFEPVLDLIAGDDADGKTVSASATAIWGAVAEGEAIPLTIAEDEFLRCPWNTPLVLYFHDGNPTPSCPTAPPAPPVVDDGDDKDKDDKDKGKPTTTTAPTTTTTAPPPAGKDGPGNFGWLETVDGCESLITTGQYEGDNGNTSPKRCTADEFATLLGRDDPILLPVYTSAVGNGSKFTYTLAGFAALRLTGYRLGGGPQWTTTPAPCTGDERCIAGEITSFQPRKATPGPGPSYGVMAVALVK